MVASREISHFTFKETVIVERLFRRHGIPYGKRVLNLGADIVHGLHAYTFVVPESAFESAIELLKDCFGLASGEAPYTGACPACGTVVENAARCPECDLNLSGNYHAAAAHHPFLVYLRHEGLL